MTYSRQCTLEYYNEGGDYECSMIAWIPEEFARIDQEISLAIDGLWEDGWIIKEIGARMEDGMVQERSRDFTRTRKASDI